MNKRVILLVNLGSPDSPEVKHVRHYLKSFLSDPRLIDLPRWFWQMILHLYILPTRPKESAKAYRRIWDGKTFPLLAETKTLAENMRRQLGPSWGQVEYAMLLGEPLLEKKLAQMAESDQILIVPLFPQFSSTTTMAVWDRVSTFFQKRPLVPHLTFFASYCESPSFISTQARLIKETLEKSGDVDRLIVSFHGLPKTNILHKGDPYYRQCWRTFCKLGDRLTEMNIHVPREMAFQSRFGQDEWLTPATDDLALTRLEEGERKLAICCPSFLTDCLETLDEIGYELRRRVEEKGGRLALVPCVAIDPEFSKAFAYECALRIPKGPANEKGEEIMQTLPKQKMKSPPLGPKTKKTLKLVFLTLFLDLVGFSIIFPLFPALIDHYTKIDPHNIFLKAVMDMTSLIGKAGGAPLDSIQTIVLFGGILGALYSFLQFIVAPLWGGLSDRIGRRPVLLISVFGLMGSYLLWVFSGSFTLLILSRIIGGIMGGNISTATAVVADITDKDNRSKGMAIVGMAFASGFIIGPAMGGLLSLFNPLDYWPSMAMIGANPFSAPATLAFLLSLANFFFLLKMFEETLPESKEGAPKRTNNPLVLFRPLPYPGFNLANFSHFIFLLAFSGMEFTLTFFARERLGFTSVDNGLMFVFIGVLMALVQGGYVRRKASSVGEKKMALQGLILTIPGLLMVAVSQGIFTFYGGVGLLALGSAMIIPCLTALTSLYIPSDSQGTGLGIFRSLGALARVIGPMAAAVAYWRWGAMAPYLTGAALLLIPFIMVSFLPEAKKAPKAKVQKIHTKEAPICT